MIVFDPGHSYLLDSLDGECGEWENRLIFVKREGEKYPGNVGHHPGTTIQEVLRALLDRCRYVYDQQPCEETLRVMDNLTHSLILLEYRADRIHGREQHAKLADIISGEGKCATCGHVGCPGCKREIQECRSSADSTSDK